MSDEDLEIAKRIAEIEGLRFYFGTFDRVKHLRLMQGSVILPAPYNPFDWAVLGPLITKYKISINYTGLFVSVGTGRSAKMAHFENDSDIPRAILKCIIKSKDKL